MAGEARLGSIEGNRASGLVATLPEPSSRPRRPWQSRLDLETVVTGSAILALMVLVVAPALSLVWASFKTGDGIGVGNYDSVLSSRADLRALGNSLRLGAYVALFSLLIALPMAWAAARTNMPGKNFSKLTATLAYLTPPFLSAIAFVNLFSPNAGLYSVFVTDVLGAPWLKFNIFSMAGMVLVTVPHTFPFIYLLAVSALHSVDASYEESAQILGAGRLRTALSITMPLVAPSVLAGILIAFVNAIALFGSQAIIGVPGRIFTMPTRIYQLFDYPPEYGLASATSLIMVAITLVALYVQRAYLARRSFVTLSGKGSRPGLIALGQTARWCLFGLTLLVFIGAVLAPYLTMLAVSFSKSWGLAFWKNLTLDNYRFVIFDFEQTRRGLANSFILSIAAATLVVLLGTVISWIDLRTRIPGRKALDYISLVPLGLPGIVMAVALLQFWLRVPLPLYGTLWILLLAYLARFVPLGVRAAGASLRQIDPSLEESARILGASWGTTMRYITLPLARPGLFAGWLLVFVPALQELSASVLLYSSDSITLSVAIFNLYETGYSEAVAAMSIVNIIVISIAITIAYKVGGLKSAEMTP
jgi:iron(III) transport system permease protein